MQPGGEAADFPSYTLFTRRIGSSIPHSSNFIHFLLVIVQVSGVVRLLNSPDYIMSAKVANYLSQQQSTADEESAAVFSKLEELYNKKWVLIKFKVKLTVTHSVTESLSEPVTVSDWQ